MQDVADDRLQAHLRWELLARPCGNHAVAGRSGRGGADQWLDRPASLGAFRLQRRVGAGRQVAFAVAILDTAAGRHYRCGGGLGEGLRLVGGGQPLGSIAATVTSAPEFASFALALPIRTGVVRTVLPVKTADTTAGAGLVPFFTFGFDADRYAFPPVKMMSS